MMQELITELKEMVRGEISGVHTALPAEIKSYDADSGLAIVKPKAKFKQPNGKTIDFPDISGVPVAFPQNKSFTIAFPIKTGDECLLIFAEQSLDFWLYGKETDTELKHDLSNAIAIPNINTKGNPDMKRACDEDAVIIKVGETELKTKKDGVYIKGNIEISGDIKVNGKVGTTGDVTAGGKSLMSHTHTGVHGGTTPPN